ncbi:MAG TPA: ABC transporter permease [Sporichthyaceae bacterium]|nr:ABC transporter permease [Sporichthyaceae bacterium]
MRSFRATEAVRFALHAVLADKLRAVLTMLAMVIGVSAVIALVAVGTGSRQAVQASIDRLGADTFWVQPHQAGTGGMGSEQQNRIRRALGLSAPASNATNPRKATLTWADLAALDNRTLAPDVAAAAPGIGIGGVAAQYRGAAHSIGLLIGTTSNYLDITDQTVESGRPFTDAEYRAHARVCLLGQTVAADLTPAAPATLDGARIRLNGQPFTVVGILAAKGYSGQADLDNLALCTATAVADTLYGYAPPGQGPINGLAVQADSPSTVAAAQAEVTRILDARHHLSMADSDFVTWTAASTLATASAADRTLTILLATVAGICLLVGGVGVMNTMLFTVRERTREIGIRKALGAERGDILGQFLAEAVILSMTGGVLGVLVGLGFTRLDVTGPHPAVSAWSIQLALAVSLVTGLAFGTYPAVRAAAAQPIDALRHE